jgi:5-methylcytosine-specific restriction endonuclease McrA
MLCSIPDRELIARLEQLRRAERETSVDVLHHLNEIERRSLHLRLGYSSLFAYCTDHLRYSESAAARRVQAARCLRRFPRVGPLLESGEINLMTLGLVANVLTEATLDQWLDRVRGRTQREVEAIAATVRPPVTLRDRARLVHVAVPTVSPLPLAPASRAAVSPAPADSPQPSAPMFASSPNDSSKDAVPPGPGALVNSSTNSQTGGKQSSTVVATRPKVYIQFLADQSFMAKYRTATALLSNKLPKLTFESVFVALIEDFIRRHGPAERHLRRERAADRGHYAAGRNPVPQPTRDAVFARDHGRCTFVGSDGKRCDETIRLHVDHIKPVARGGSNDIANLRLLCARHNQLQAERILGREVMNGFRKRESVATVRDAP